MKTAAGGHSAGTDTPPVSLEADEERIGSSSGEEDETDGQPRKKRRKQGDEKGAVGPPEKPADPPGDRAKSETPPEESRA